MNNDHLFEWRDRRFAAEVSVEGWFSSTVWRWHYDGHDYWQQRLYCPASVITQLLAIGPHLSAFWFCYYIKVDDKWLMFLQTFVYTVLSNTGSLRVFWRWFVLGEENQQCGHQLRSAITKRTIGVCLPAPLLWYCWFFMNEDHSGGTRWDLPWRYFPRWQTSTWLVELSQVLLCVIYCCNGISLRQWPGSKPVWKDVFVVFLSGF